MVFIHNNIFYILLYTWEINKIANDIKINGTDITVITGNNTTKTNGIITNDNNIPSADAKAGIGEFNNMRNNNIAKLNKKNFPNDILYFNLYIFYII